ncbi:MAG TPA: condensation domain-containing protein, partial [Longimicrobium sp.]|nr:condensation domain-containing protein [Longimicrobium sp.]
ALGEVVRRHESLRTVFREVDGAPVQVIVPFAPLALRVDDLSALDAEARAAELARRVEAEAVRPFDLAAGPLFRAGLLREDAESHVLLVCMHHVVSDAWSMGVLFRDLSALYGVFREGREPSLPEPPVQYADYAVWQREQLRGEPLERELAYWRQRLSGAPALLDLPADRPRPAVQTYRGAYERVELPAELLERLRALGRGEGATLFMVLLGAFQVLLSRYSGSEDVVVGSPIAGRTRREVEELVGFFVNTLVLRTELEGDPPFREVLRRVREATLGAYEHQEVPFERLVAELQPERSLSHSPLFQVMFALQDEEAARAELAGVRTEEVRLAPHGVKFDLVLSLAEHADGLAGTATYSADLFDPPTIRRMLGHLAHLLEQVADRPEARLSELALADDAEALAAAAGEAEGWQGAEGCIHHAFQAQAERTPDAVALVWEHESLTYGELNQRANRLAHHLRALGVGAETRVGICLERGMEMVVSLLAVLKAGGAYVPLDPAYPAERLAWMLADAG